MFSNSRKVLESKHVRFSSEEKGLISPHQLLLSQVDYSRELTGPEKLLWATMQNGIDCIVGRAVVSGDGVRRGRSRKMRRWVLAQEAYEWMMSNSSDYFLSFLQICAYFNFDHQYIRQKLSPQYFLFKAQGPPPPIVKRKRGDNVDSLISGGTSEGHVQNNGKLYQ